MRELQAGVYNLLKSTHRHALPVGQFMDRVNASDDEVEGNLSTILQSVRGSKQYWYRHNSELMCMLREFGPPTFFLTLSCAEYESTLANSAPRIHSLCQESFHFSESKKFTSRHVGNAKNIHVYVKLTCHCTESIV